jgi:hypothetical protein
MPKVTKMKLVNIWRIGMLVRCHINSAPSLLILGISIKQ